MSNITSKEQLLNDPSVFQKIQERAYFIAQSTGFVSGREHENWVAAEEEVLAKLMANGTANGVSSNDTSNGVANDATSNLVTKIKAPAKKAAAKPKVAATNEATTNEATTNEATTIKTPIKRAPKKSA